MAGLVEVVGKYLKPYYFRILVVILSIIFLYAGYYAYNTYYLNNMTDITEINSTDVATNKYNNIANANMRSQEVLLYFFHVDWCPHCKTSIPVWDKFKETYVKKYNEDSSNRYILKCISINCTDESDSKIVKIINDFQIESYPTIKMEKQGQRIEFDSKITEHSLEQFVETMVNDV